MKLSEKKTVPGISGKRKKNSSGEADKLLHVGEGKKKIQFKCVLSVLQDA